jgi:hypothetical protein
MVEILLDHFKPFAVLAVTRLNKPCRCRTRVNNARVWVQNQLNCGEVRSLVGRTRARRRRKILTGIDVG